MLDIASAGDGGAPFSRIRGVIRLTDGRIVVAEDSGPRLLWLSSDGALRATAGPVIADSGLVSVWPVGRLPGDAVVVWDAVTARLSVFAADGGLSHSYRLPDDSEAITPWRVLPDGSLLATVSHEMKASPDGAAVRDTTVLWSLDPATGERQEILRTPGALWVFRPSGAQRVPYTGNPVFDIDGDDIIVSAGSDPVIERWTRTGRLLERMSDGREPLRVSPAMQARYRERRLRELRDPAVAPILLGDMAAWPWPEYAMAWDRLLVAEDGRIWVRGYETDRRQAAVWTVFDRSAGVIARTRTPPGFELMVVTGDLLLGVGAEEAGPEHVQAYRIER